MNEFALEGLVFLLIGLFPIVASIANWDFFFENRKAAFFVNLFGRNGARIFYSVLGFGIFLMGFLSVIGTINLD